MTTPIVPEELDAVLDRCGRGREAAIPILQGVQELLGYIPREAMEYIVAHSEIDAVQLYGVATFYTQFRLQPVGRHRIKVCHGTACHVSGATEITESIRRTLDLRGEDDTTSDRLVTVEDVACLGCCSLAPVIMVDGISHGKLTPDSVAKIVTRYREDWQSNSPAATEGKS
jgi:NADH:ubiquinone oxidoreductase subunit E